MPAIISSPIYHFTHVRFGEVLNLSMFVTNDGTKYIIYLATDQNIHELTADKAETQWTDSIISNPESQPGPNIITGFHDNNQEYVVYISYPFSHVHSLAKSLKANKWVDNDLTTTNLLGVSGRRFSRCVILIL